MSCIYEWDVETVTIIDSDEHEAEEVLDHQFCKTFKEALSISKMEPPQGCRFDLVLVRDTPTTRSWAYVSENTLPEFFEDAYGNEVGVVPTRFCTLLWKKI